MQDSTDEILKKMVTSLNANSAVQCARDAVCFDQSKVAKLSANQITSPVYVVAPTQIDYIAEIFGNQVASALNMLAFAPKIKQVAKESLIKAFGAAKTQGSKK